MGERIATNKKARRDYIIMESWECGIELRGAEVKSVRAGNVSFKDTFARIEKNQVKLYNLHINPYENASSAFEEEPDRIRRLLMHKKEIKKIESKVAEKNLTLIPTKIYFNNRGLCKVELALGKGKRQFDKREDIKRKTIERSLNRVIRNKSR